MRRLPLFALSVLLVATVLSAMASAASAGSTPEVVSATPSPTLEPSFELVFRPGTDGGCDLYARGTGHAPEAARTVAWTALTPDASLLGGTGVVTVGDAGAFEAGVAPGLERHLRIEVRLGDGTFDTHVVLDAPVTCDRDETVVAGMVVPFELVFTPATGDACRLVAHGTGFTSGEVVEVSHEVSGSGGFSGGLNSVAVEQDGTFEMPLDEGVANGWVVTAELLDSTGATRYRIGGAVECDGR